MHSHRHNGAERGATFSLLVWAAVLAGCPAPTSPPSTPLSPASSEGPGATAGATGQPEEIAAPWDLHEELPKLHEASPRAPSQHGTGELDGQVFRSDAAEGYPSLGPDRRFGPGATLVEMHLERGGTKPLFYFVMVKRDEGYDPASGNWEYLVLEQDGQIEERGRLPLCKRCHVDAPHDFLFGPGR